MMGFVVFLFWEVNPGHHTSQASFLPRSDTPNTLSTFYFEKGFPWIARDGLELTLKPKLDMNLERPSLRFLSTWDYKLVSPDLMTTRFLAWETERVKVQVECPQNTHGWINAAIHSRGQATKTKSSLHSVADLSFHWATTMSVLSSTGYGWLQLSGKNWAIGARNIHFGCLFF